MVKRRQENDADGKAVYAAARQLKKIQGYFGLVFQNFNLFPHYTVRKNLTDAPIHIQKRDRREVYRQAEELLKKMGLEDKRITIPVSCQADSSRECDRKGAGVESIDSLL